MSIFSFIGYTLTENLTIDDKFKNKRVRLFIHQMTCLKLVEKKKLLGRVIRLLITFKKNAEAATGGVP